MEDYIKLKVLDEENLSIIRGILDEATWIDGLKTAPGATKGLKNNLEIARDHHHEKIESIVKKELNKKLEYIDFCSPGRITRLLVSRVEVGGYYHVHHDSGLMGHYSTTIFLSDPSTYEGGELCLLVNGKEKAFKLEPGWAVIYDTGIMHRVNRVEKGTRSAIAFWTRSRFNDPVIRSVFVRIEQAWRSMEWQHHHSFDEAKKDPKFLISEARNTLLRYYT